MTPEAVLEHLARRLPHFEPIGTPELLRGGYLNYVWRVRGQPAPVIVKVTPPYIAAMPGVSLDPNRIRIEARSLAAMGPGGELAAIASAGIRPPRLLDFDERVRVLVMEDVGAVPHLGTWLRSDAHPGRSGLETGRLLGGFVGALHSRSHGDPGLAQLIDNKSIQQSRLEIQYRAIGDLCERAGLIDAGELGSRAIALGELLQQPGLCVIMGDLWPPSILIAPDGIRVIDWELAHYGRPSQDVGHLAAHLWMYSHRASSSAAIMQARDTLRGFLSEYKSTVGMKFEELFGLQGVRESAVHLGCEILVRAVGAFKEGGYYEGLGMDAPLVREAVEVAAEHIRSPQTVPTFSALSA